MAEPRIISFLGKGGTGKTVLSAMTGKIASEKGFKTLYIDADPSMGLMTALGIEHVKTIGHAREEIISAARASSGTDDVGLANMMDYLMMETLRETVSFGFIAMGHSTSLGCYCPLNTLLRQSIQWVANEYDVVIIDAEAGIEQVSRQVTEQVHYPILVTDNTLRGVRTALFISDAIERSPLMNPLRKSILFNRTADADPGLKELAKTTGLIFEGTVPEDVTVRERDMKGKPAFDMPADSAAYRTLAGIIEGMGILKGCVNRAKKPVETGINGGQFQD